jgi:hypothetical protein
VHLRWDLLGLPFGWVLPCGHRIGDGDYLEADDLVCAECWFCGDCCGCLPAASDHPPQAEVAAAPDGALLPPVVPRSTSPDTVVVASRASRVDPSFGDWR